MALSIEDQELANQVADIATQISDAWLANPTLGAILRNELEYKELELLLNSHQIAS